MDSMDLLFRTFKEFEAWNYSSLRLNNKYRYIQGHWLCCHSTHDCHSVVLLCHMVCSTCDPFVNCILVCVYSVLIR